MRGAIVSTERASCKPPVAFGRLNPQRRPMLWKMCMFYKIIGSFALVCHKRKDIKNSCLNFYITNFYHSLFAHGMAVSKILSVCLSIHPSPCFFFLSVMIQSEVRLQSLFAALMKTWLEYVVIPSTNTHTCANTHPEPVQWRALINSQGVHVVVASGVIKRPSEPSQERGGIGGGQRGSRCRTEWYFGVETLREGERIGPSNGAKIPPRHGQWLSGASASTLWVGGDVWQQRRS